ncbi:hypothetical protein DFJ74DRAFT_765319 [Hyaloraphidium curvatum]|nr:hypothetical protein DFJ74DRAFT_765319 [Hyaloraphidium curvatum]
MPPIDPAVKRQYDMPADSGVPDVPNGPPDAPGEDTRPDVSDPADASLSEPAPNGPEAPPADLSADAIAASITQRFLKAQADKKAAADAAFGERDMLVLLRHHVAHARKFYDSDAAQEAARNAMPVDRFHEEVLSTLAEGDDFFAALAKAAMRWFKAEFFTWVNAPPCSSCGCEPARMESKGMAEPTPEDLRHGARRVESYACPDCRSVTRFPRYNDPVKLLESRRGRCGEWANCFALCLRSLGFDARWVLDSTDHVWCEVWIEDGAGGGRYLHMDPCEDAWDAPLLYERGWGKKLSYVFAFTGQGVQDVIRKYSRDWEGVRARRTRCSEEALARLVEHVNGEALTAAGGGGAEAARRRQLDADHFEAAFLAGEAGGEAENVGRVSGSVEWRKARGELGTGGEADPDDTPCPAPDGMELVFELPVRPSSDDTGLLAVLNGSAELSLLHGPTPISRHPILSVQLTPPTNDQRGSFFAIPLLRTDASWLAEFAFRIDGGGADGFAFVLHGDHEEGPMALGTGGAELGYGGLRRAVAVEFDTYESKDRADDPNGNHIALMVPPSGSPLAAHHRLAVACTTHLPKLNDGTLYYSRIAYSAPTGELAVYLTELPADPNVCLLEGEECGPPADADPVPTLRGRDYRRVLAAKVDLAAAVGEEACVGFTAATGGLCQRHEVCGVRVWTAREGGGS